ncbi:hypothetical protein JK358_16035 [Nocardia sp. 2]|uniref:DoxX family protein n=1 Tax=Nocardia acididurans TaxID=2802282 RepID=A0ABS1M5K3_9NOCA|nr:hypothetical protein [Nocardia acididurans]MBL1075907.1 hypothetical protein [Nocardia acididurans]
MVGEWLRHGVRVVLSLLMIAFGMVKVIPTQFISFTLPGEMLVSVGESTSSGLLWKFMAASTPYTVITGLVEVTGGVLLVFRRTTLLGALISLVALIQVSILNLAYGVPVVVTPLVMLGMALVVSLPWWQRLLDVLVRHRDSAAPRTPPLLGDPRWRRAGLAAHVTAAAFVAMFMGVNGFQQYRDYTQRLSPLDGVWAVDQYRGAGPEWVRVAIEARPASQRLVVARAAGGPLERDAVVSDTEAVLHVGDSTLTWTRPDARTLRLTGVLDGADTEVTLYRVPLRNESNEFR